MIPQPANAPEQIQQQEHHQNQPDDPHAPTPHLPTRYAFATLNSGPAQKPITAPVKNTPPIAQLIQRSAYWESFCKAAMSRSIPSFHLSSPAVTPVTPDARRVDEDDDRVHREQKSQSEQPTTHRNLRPKLVGG